MVPCSYCGATDGHGSNGKRGINQRYVCGKCGKCFEVPIDAKESKASKYKLLQTIAENYTEGELKAIANGGRLVPGQCRVPIINFDGPKLKIGVISDTHLGSKYSPGEWLTLILNEFKKDGVAFVVHAGDVTEGLSSRPGHIYELDQIGYDAQKEHAIEALKQWDGKFYFISGNHDLWYLKNGNTGADIVKDICRELPNAEYLGRGEGTISINGKISIMLWHGEDGSSYALSYRLQKIIESLPVGEKPSVLIAGHDHKAIFIPALRGVMCFGAGCLQRQTPWMRQTKKAAMCGAWTITMTIGKMGLAKIAQEFYPLYA